MTLIGLVLLYGTTGCAFLLIMRIVLHDSTALWLVVLMGLWFALWWFAVPLWARNRTRRD